MGAPASYDNRHMPHVCANKYCRVPDWRVPSASRATSSLLGFCSGTVFSHCAMLSPSPAAHTKYLSPRNKHHDKLFCLGWGAQKRSFSMRTLIASSGIVAALLMASTAMAQTPKQDAQFCLKSSPTAQP